MRVLFVSASLAVMVALGGCATEVGGEAGLGVGASVGLDLGVTAEVAPPALEAEVQPQVPGEGYIWTPGYWAWNAGVSDYYWVAGAWVQPPSAGLLWTPGYWGWTSGAYVFHAGYWGPHVGFYGGVNYGFGYGGFGFDGGEWRGGRFFYNRSVTNITRVNITNVYSRTVINNTSRVSYNGGGGVHAEPRAEELAAARESHVFATPDQQRRFQAAKADPAMRFNHGARHGGIEAAGFGRPEPGPGPRGSEGSPGSVQPSAGGPVAFPGGGHAPTPVRLGADGPAPGGSNPPVGGLPGGGRPGGPPPGAGLPGGPPIHAAPGRPGGFPGGRPGGPPPGPGHPGGPPGGQHPGPGRPSRPPPGGPRPNGAPPPRAPHPGGGHPPRPHPNGGRHEGQHS